VLFYAGTLVVLWQDSTTVDMQSLTAYETAILGSQECNTIHDI